MASKVEICNKALLKIGQQPIMSINDDSPRARMCLSEFDSALGATLRSFAWPFAMVRRELARVDEKPPFGYSHYYKIPSDSARIIEVFSGNGDYQIERGLIASNAERVAIRYITKDINAEDLDDQTVEVVALDLAVRLSVVITENLQLKDMLHAEHTLAMAQARNIWSTENKPVEVLEGNWLYSHERGSKDYLTSVWNPWGPDGRGVID